MAAIVEQLTLAWAIAGLIVRAGMDQQWLAVAVAASSVVGLLLIWLQWPGIGAAAQEIGMVAGLYTRNTLPTATILVEPEESSEQDTSTGPDFRNPPVLEDLDDEEIGLLKLEQPLTAAIGRIPNPRVRGQSYCQLGDICLRMRRPQRGLSCYRHALLAARSAEDRNRQCIAWGGIARCLWEMGHAGAAVQCCLRALIVARDAEYRPGESAALSNLGNLWLLRGELSHAIDCHVDALAISSELGDRSAEARDWLNLGSCYAAAGEPWRAIDHLSRAREIANQESEPITEVLAICAMAKALQSAERFKAAMEHWQQAGRLADELCNSYLQAAASAGQGTLWTRLGRSRRAIKCYQRALSLLGNERDALVYEVCWNLGIEYLNAGRSRQALIAMTPYARHLQRIGHAQAAGFARMLDKGILQV